MAAVVLIALATLYASGCLAGPGNPIVRIQEGRVAGVTSQTRNGRDILEFRGIPYAENPTGELRFRSPVPKKPWRNVYRPPQELPLCPQINVTDGSYVGDEDCLYLNVFTPTLRRSAALPVIVYIHGGAFILGGSKQIHPGYLLDKNIVLVTVNYRLGAMGFLSTGDLEAPGNYGLKDQRLALKWVRRNIRAFGGDPSKVTLVGQSAGGASVNLHALSDSTNGLFKQYVIQSGPGLAYWATRNVSTYSQYPSKVAKLNKCKADNSSDIVACLRNMTAEDLTKSYFVFLDDINSMLSISLWGPVAEPNSDDAFLTQSAIDLFKNNKMKDYPFIIGHTKDEGLLITAFLYTSKTLYKLYMKNLDSLLRHVLSDYVQSDEVLEELIEQVKDYYLGDLNLRDRNEVIRKVTKLISDLYFIYPEELILHHQAGSAKNNFYQYSFNYRGTESFTASVLGNNTDVGVTHADDLIYLLPHIFMKEKEKKSETDFEVVDTMVDLWTSFAATGVPRSKSIDIEWKPYGKEQNYIQIGDGGDPSVRARHSCFSPKVVEWLKCTTKLQN